MFEVDWKNTTSAEDAPDARGKVNYSGSLGDHQD